MANPFIDKAKSSNASKFKNITGKSGGGQKFDGSKQGSPKIASGIKSGGDMNVPGKKGFGRADKYARGGRTKKGATTVNVNIIQPKDGGGPTPVPVPIPAGGPPPGGPPPGMMPPPGPMARGGRLPKAGAESGEGRLQKAKLYK